MRVLVTGGTGFVGSHLIERLVRRGDEVSALVRSTRKAALLPPGLRVVQGDLDDAGALHGAAEGQQIVYHVAGRTAAANEEEFFAVNERGTARLLEAARHAGTARFVLVSSLAAVGPSRPGRPHAEDPSAGPVSAYGRSKLAGEQAVRRSGLDWTIVRPPLVYGPRDREVLRVFRLCRSGWAVVFGNGDQELSTVYGPDLAEALVAAATSAAAVGRIYYACADERCTSREFVEAVGVASGRRRVRVVRLPESAARFLLRGVGGLAGLVGRTTLLGGDKVNEFFQPAWTGDPSALARDTGWRARHGLAAGLAETARWYREAGWL